MLTEKSEIQTSQENCGLHERKSNDSTGKNTSKNNSKNNQKRRTLELPKESGQNRRVLGQYGKKIISQILWHEETKMQEKKSGKEDARENFRNSSKVSCRKLLVMRFVELII